MIGICARDQDGVKPSPRKPIPERRRDLAYLRQMRHQLGLGLVHGFDRRAREFELAARLQRNRAAPVTS